MYRTILAITIGIIGLVLIRLYEEYLFYDPFIEYYSTSSSTDFSSVTLNLSKWIIFIVFRYSLNALCIGVIMFGILDFLTSKGLLRLILVSMIVLIPALLLAYYYSNDDFVFFYIRRLLIQPYVGFAALGAAFYKRNAQFK